MTQKVAERTAASGRMRCHQQAGNKESTLRRWLTYAESFYPSTPRLRTLAELDC